MGGSFWQTTVVTDEPLIDPQARLRTLCHAVPGQWMTEGIGFYCGIAMRWFRDAFCELERSEAARRGVDAYVVMEEAAAQVPPGSNGVIGHLLQRHGREALGPRVAVVPRLRRRSAGGVGPDGPASGRIEEQAAYDGAWPPGHHLGADRATRTTNSCSPAARPRASYGHRSSPTSLGLPVRVPVVKESTALGAAIYAGIGAGLYRDLVEVAASLVRSERIFEPVAEARRTYDERYAAWRALYPRILDLSETGLLRPMWWPAGA